MLTISALLPLFSDGDWRSFHTCSENHAFLSEIECSYHLIHLDETS